jgi:putative DNA primase/helicase
MNKSPQIITPTNQLMLSVGMAFTVMPYGKKRPMQIGWNKREKVITTNNELHRLVGNNIGLAHAYCMPRPTCAIDIDDVIAGEKWLLSNGINLNDLLNATDAVGIESGKPNSAKLIFLFPENVPALVSKSIVGPDGKMMIEFRCATKNGLTLQDVLPPSLHPSGTTYKWVGNGSILNLPTIPSSLFALWLNLLKSKEKIRKPIYSKYQRPETNKNIAILDEQLTYIDADCDYETYRNVVWGIASTGWDCAHKKAMQWSMTAEHRFEEHTLDALFNSYDPEREDSITYGTIYHLANVGGWNE